MGQRYRESSHGLYDLKAHVVWITKYRYPVLTGPIAIRLRELVRRIGTENGADIISGVVSPKHVHIMVSYPPNVSLSKLVQFMKGTSSRKLQQEFPALGKRYWGQHLWARGFFAVSTGNVTTEMIEQYIKNHKGKEYFAWAPALERAGGGSGILFARARRNSPHTSPLRRALTQNF